MYGIDAAEQSAPRRTANHPGKPKQRHDSPMDTQERDRQRELEAYVQKRLDQHREVLEVLTERDTELSTDTEYALQIFDELEGQE